MKIYNYKKIEESMVSLNGGISTATYYYPVDENGSFVEYLTKFRVLLDNQMIIFDDEQEYRDYLSTVVPS